MGQRAWKETERAIHQRAWKEYGRRALRRKPQITQIAQRILGSDAALVVDACFGGTGSMGLLVGGRDHSLRKGRKKPRP